MPKLPKNAKIAAIVGGCMVAVVLPVVAVFAVRNSKQYRMMKAYQRTGAVLDRTGSILQAISEAMG